MAGTEKVVVVVGASGSIGSELVSALLRTGCRVVAVARGQQRLDELVNRLDPEQTRLTAHAADFTDEKQVRDCFDAVHRTMSRIDFLIYCVGIAPDPDIPLASYPTAAWHATMDAYATGFFLCFREALRSLEPGGHIVAISSAVTRFPGDSLPPLLYVGHYAAAKAALDEMIKWGRREAHERQILLSRFAPGAVDTPFHRTAPPHRRPRAMLPMQIVVERIVTAVMDGKELDEELVAAAG